MITNFIFILWFSDECESIVHTCDDIAPVGYLNFTKIRLLEKSVSYHSLIYYVNNLYIYNMYSINIRSFILYRMVWRN